MTVKTITLSSASFATTFGSMLRDKIRKLSIYLTNTGFYDVIREYTFRKGA